MPRKTMAACLVLAVAGLSLGGYVVYHSLWGTSYHSRAAQQALDRYDFPSAEEHVTRCLEVQPNHAETHLLAARIARRAVHPILPGGADGPAACLTAGTVRYGDDYDKVEGHLAKYHTSGGLLEVLNLEINLLRAQRGELQLVVQFRDAPAAVEKVLHSWVQEGHPAALLILEALVKGYLRDYRLPDALNCLNDWLERREDVQALLWRAWVAVRLGDEPNGLKDYRRALDLVPEHDRLRLRVAEMLLASDGPAEAVGHYERLRQRNHPSPAVLLGLAQCKKRLGEGDECRRLLGELAAEHPKYVPGLIERGKMALDDQQGALAEDALREAVKLEPFNQLANYNLYLCLLQRGKKEEARQYAARRDQIEKDLLRMGEVSRRVMARPRDADLRFEAGTILLRNGLKEDGRRWLLSALRENPLHAKAHAALADYYEKEANQPELAEPHRRLAREIEAAEANKPSAEKP